MDVEKLYTSNSEVATDTQAEMPSRQFSVDQLHQGIIRYKNEELVYEDPERHPTIEIVDEDVIEVESCRIALSGLRSFIFNVLRLNQGYAMTSEDVHDLGFRGERSTININLQWLMRAMKQGAGETFIEREQPNTNGKAFYTLLPEVRILDRRDELQLSPTERLLQECGAIESDGSIRMRENGSVDFAAPRFRVRTNLAMIDEYRDQAKVDLTIAHLLEKRLGYRSLQEPIMPVRRYEPSSPQETARLLELKEQSLVTYLEGLAARKDPDEHEKQAIIEGIRAGYELFARNVDLANKYARIHASPLTPYQELYQETAMLLLESVLTQGYDNTGLHNFQFVTTEMMKSHKGRGVTPLKRFLKQPVNYPWDYTKDVPRFMDVKRELQSELGYEPSASACAERLNISVDRVLGIIALSGGKPYSLDGQSQMLGYNSERDSDDPDLTPPVLQIDDFSDELLERMEQELAIGSIFASEKLTTAEKVVLSLYYQIFQPSLCNLEIKQGESTYRYPENEEDFTVVTAKFRSLHSLGADIMNFSGHYVLSQHRRALRKARAILEANPGFDTYSHTNTIEARQLAEKEEVERQEIIKAAIVASPDQRLGRREIRSLSQTGTSFSEERITELFGSLPEFQIACGFEPDKQWIFRDLSQEETITLALKLKPDGPLTSAEIADLSKRGDFPGYNIIKRLFGSVPEFQIACGFEPNKGVLNQNLAAEEIVKRALKLKPDGSLKSDEIRQYSKGGELPSEATIKRLFGSVPEFQKACGFKPHKKNMYSELTKEQAIALALKLKPDSPLTSAEIAELSKRGDFPGHKVVKRLFGELPDFQIACGFEPDKASVSRSLTADDVVKRALELKPDAPLTVGEVRAYSKKGVFTSYATVKQLFGTFSHFKKACGFDDNA